MAHPQPSHVMPAWSPKKFAFCSASLACASFMLATFASISARFLALISSAERPASLMSAGDAAGAASSTQLTLPPTPYGESAGGAGTFRKNAGSRAPKEGKGEHESARE